MATTESVNVCYHKYEDLRFKDYLDGLAASKLARKKFKHPNPHADPKPPLPDPSPDDPYPTPLAPTPPLNDPEEPGPNVIGPPLDPPDPLPV